MPEPSDRPNRVADPTRVVHLIRHAHAGSRSAWLGDDRERPLSAKGRAQARAITDALTHADIIEVWSSPYLRCVQTVEPLATRLGTPVVEDPRLAEGEDAAAVLDAVLARADAGRTMAVCSHGDVIPALVVEAVRRGATLHGPAELRKGARYTVTVEAGRATQIHHVERPDV
jgi:8-oxo-dGTP diphosphatase